jgi:hypothetical protein
MYHFKNFPDFRFKRRKREGEEEGKEKEEMGEYNLINCWEGRDDVRQRK